MGLPVNLQYAGDHRCWTRLEGDAELRCKLQAHGDHVIRNAGPARTTTLANVQEASRRLVEHGSDLIVARDHTGEGDLHGGGLAAARQRDISNRGGVVGHRCRCWQRKESKQTEGSQQTKKTNFS